MRWISIWATLIGQSPAEVSFSPAIPLTDHLWNTDTVVAFDLDQDGDLDLIGSEPYGSRIVWWLNDGDGNFGFGQEWMWQEDLLAYVLAMGDFDGDSRLEILFAPDVTKDYQPESLLISEWIDGAISTPEVASSLITEDRLHPSEVFHLNEDGVPDFIDDGNAYLSSPDFAYERFQGLPSERGAITAEVDGDEIREIFTFESNNEVIRVDLSKTEPMVTRVITKIPDNEDLKEIVFHPATNEIISYSTKNLSEGLELPWWEVEYEWILRAHPSDGDLNTVPKIIERKSFFRATYRILYLHLDEITQRVVVDEHIYDSERSRTRAEYSEIVVGEQGYELIEILESDYTTNKAPPLYRDLNGDGITDLVIPFSSIGRTTGSFVDQLSWLRGDESENGFSDDVRPISTEGLAHTLKYFGDIDGDGDNDFLTQFTEALDSKTRGMVGAWQNDGTGNFELHKIAIESSGVWATIDVIKAVDIVGSPTWLSEVPGASNDWPEGRMDFIVKYQDIPLHSDEDTFVRYLLQDSLGKFHFSDVSASATKTPFAYYRLFDWDRDGNDELLAFTNDGQDNRAQVWLADLNGQELKNFSPIFSPVEFPQIVDLDQDGLFDLVSSNQYSSGSDSPYWLKNDGSNSSAGKESLSYHVIASEYDLDGDGYEDFWARDDSRRALFFVPGALNEGENFNGEPRAFGIGSYDVDGDGDLDRIIRRIAYRTSTFWGFHWDETLEVKDGEFLVSRQHELASVAQRYASPYREITGFGDIDGDGIPDLLSVSSNRIEWFKMTRTEQPAVFSNWMASKRVTGHSASQTLDYDLDGRSNWEEFVFGSHPDFRDLNSSSIPGVRMGDDGMEFSFLFRSDADELGLSVANFRSSDMTNWIPMSEGPTVTPVDDEYQRISYPLTLGLGREFFQTNFSPPPAE